MSTTAYKQSRPLLPDPPSTTSAPSSCDEISIEKEAHTGIEAVQKHHPDTNPISSIEKLGRDYCPWDARLWIFEISSSVVAILGMLTIYAILFHYNGRPQKDWETTYFTLNGIVALLATVTKAALMIPVSTAISQLKWLWFEPRQSSTVGKKLTDFQTFDSASRGIWGSLQLLWSLRFHHVASIGAFVTSMSLLFSTLTQNAITTSVRTVPTTDQTAIPGVVPRSERYATNAGNLVNSTLPDVPSLAATYEGIFKTNVETLQVTCPTGNCTWPVVPTIGICGGCYDMTENLVRNCNATWCIYNVPPSSTILLTWNEGNTGIESDASSSPLEQGRTYPVFTGGYADGITDSGPNRTFGEFDFIGVSGKRYLETKDEEGFFNYPQKEDIKATRCSLWACMQAHEIKTTSGQQSSAPTKTWAQGVSGRWIDQDWSFNFTDIPEDFNVDPDVVYGLDMLFTLRADYLMLGTVTDDRRGNFEFLSESFKANANTGFETTQAIWAAAHDLPSFFGNLSLSLSNWMRQAGTSASTTRYAGEALSQEAYFEAQFLWLVFPATLVALSTLLLVVSIVQTSRHKVPAWKDNALSVLFVTVEPCLQEEVSEESSVKRVAKQIRKRKVKLIDDTNGWILG